ncbi:MAG: carbohydrate ABC transporter permease [Spirochaetia bacterium]|jgi:raffinose/stachyose/melibiose transport system permease protein|nr:carbohydrate ABC transporter permease [Spirochaetia bacterium]
MNVRKILHLIGYVLFVCLAVANIYPLVFSLFCSLKGNLEIFQSFMALPKHFRYQNYITAWKVGRIGRYFANTIFLAAMTIVLSAAVGSLASYILSRFRFHSKNFVYFFFIAGLMIPMQAVLIPLSYLLGKLGAMNKYSVLILLFTGFCLPMTIMIITSYMKSIPRELEESAVMDYANTVQIFMLIIFPLIQPAIISVSIFNFIQVWNNLLFPLIFISDSSKGTISMGLLSFFGEFSTNYSASMAGICLTTIPVVIAYLFFQEKIENGIMSGALKG